MAFNKIDYFGNLFATNFGELGLEVSYIKGYESPLGNTYLYNLKYISQYNKNYLNSLLVKIAVYHHFDLKLIDTKEAHFGIFDITNSQQSIPLSNYLYGRKITIGLDEYGREVSLDFNEIPHLLIAGTTGSGKSVCINCIIASILMRTKPDEVKLVMVDPKKVELSNYNGVPHLLMPVVTEPKKASVALQKIVHEMELRYDEFEAKKVKNIATYNAWVDKENENTERDISDKEYSSLFPECRELTSILSQIILTTKKRLFYSLCFLYMKINNQGGLRL